MWRGRPVRELRARRPHHFAYLLSNLDIPQAKITNNVPVIAPARILLAADNPSSMETGINTAASPNPIAMCFIALLYAG